MRHGIRFSVMSRLIAIIIIVLISFAAISYFSFYYMMQNNISQRGKEDALKDLAQIESAIEDVSQLGKLLSLNQDVLAFLTANSYSSPSDKVIAITKLLDKVEQNILLKKYIHSFCIVTTEGEAYWNTCPYDSFFIDWLEAKALNGESVTGHIGFTESYAFPVRTNSNNYIDLVSCISNVSYVKNGILSSAGQIIINLDLTSLMKDINNKSSIFHQIGILNENSDILYLTNGNRENFSTAASRLSSNFQKINGDYYFSNKINTTKWNIVSISSKEQLKQMMDFPFLFIVISLFIVSLCLIFIFVFPMLLHISRQIVVLDQAMEAVANGNLDTSVSLTGVRELHNISDEFNRMIIKTKEYMKEALDNLEAKQNVSFELLLAKINPHFIYNTLNSVIYLARKNKNKEIIDLTSAFIYLLQDSIHLGENIMFERIETEAEVIKKYIIIQKYRYTDRFSFHCSLDPQLYGTYIPKNMLQPLIENAIIHGICPKESSGHIELSLQKSDDQIQITIADDGVGMEQEKIEQLLSLDQISKAQKKSPKMRPIGIQNIAEKLKFIYPSNHRFNIISSPGSGTTIDIIIPVVHDNDKEKTKFSLKL